MEGYAHMLLKPEIDVAKLFKYIGEQGLMQHWGTVYGDITTELTYLMRQLELELKIL